MEYHLQNSIRDFFKLLISFCFIWSFFLSCLTLFHLDFGKYYASPEETSIMQTVENSAQVVRP